MLGTLGATSVAAAEAVQRAGSALGAAACATNGCQIRRTAHAVDASGCPSHAFGARQPLATELTFS